MLDIALLGSTGSIGTSTLDVVRRYPDRFRVSALAAGWNVDRLAEQVREFAPRLVATGDKRSADALRARLEGPLPEIVWGNGGLDAVATFPDAARVVSALVGMVGLGPTVAAIEAGKSVALANKEPMVTAGPLLIDLAKKRGVELIPVDSEHSAIYQCLYGKCVGTEPRTEVKSIILTASGGPFLDRDPAGLADISPEEATAHPNWDMGPKISVDSATMMNKGLEVIEAQRLFGLPADRIRVLVHPESVVHALVEFVDGQVLAQMAAPDMRGPIAFALSVPERLPGVIRPLDLAAVGSLTFREADRARFPLLGMAYEAIESGGTAPALLNAGNEVAVDAFLRRLIRYAEIVDVVRHVLESVATAPLDSIETVVEADRRARDAADGFVRERKR